MQVRMQVRVRVRLVSVEIHSLVEHGLSSLVEEESLDERVR